MLLLLFLASKFRRGNRNLNEQEKHKNWDAKRVPLSWMNVKKRMAKYISSSSISLSRDSSIASSILSFSVFGERLSRKSYNVVVFPFAFHIAVPQPWKPLWSRLLLCDHEPSHPSTVLCFMSLLMSLLPASGEFVSEFHSPRVILSFFPPPWPYRLGWPCQELKLPPASLSGSWKQ
jgi:hypothetical protein